MTNLNDKINECNAVKDSEIDEDMMGNTGMLINPKISSMEITKSDTLVKDEKGNAPTRKEKVDITKRMLMKHHTNSREIVDNNVVKDGGINEDVMRNTGMLINTKISSMEMRKGKVKNIKGNNPTTKEKNEKARQMLEKHHTNLREILKYSNATPIHRYEDMGYKCCYCEERYRKPGDLKRHTFVNHSDDDFDTASFMGKRMSLRNYSVKLDITSLLCNICDTYVNTLDELMDHLGNLHCIKLYTDIKTRIMCFKFDDETLRCFICFNVFYNFKGLQEHMQVHYRNEICELCDTGFINRQFLVFHRQIHKIGSFRCHHCPKVYKTTRIRAIHEKTSHTTRTVQKCGYCSESFKYHFQKMNHLADVHNVHSTVKCQACGKSFRNAKLMKLHVKELHLMEKLHKCPECGMRFHRSYGLKKHMMRHMARKLRSKVFHKTSK